MTVMLVLMVTLVGREMAGIIIKLFGYFLCLVPVLLDIKKSFSSTVALIELTLHDVRCVVELLRIVVTTCTCWSLKSNSFSKLVAAPTLGIKRSSCRSWLQFMKQFVQY